MYRATFVFLVLLAWAQTAASEQCSVDADEDSDQNALLQVRVTLDEVSKDSEPYSYGPHSMKTPVLEYFKNWAHGFVKGRLSRMLIEDTHLGAMQMDTSSLTEAVAIDVLFTTITRDCPLEATDEEIADTGSLQHIRSPAAALIGEAEYKVLHAEPADSQGVYHTLLQDRFGRLQYLASYHQPNGVHLAIKTDPPVCSKSYQASLLEKRSATKIKASDPYVDPYVSSHEDGSRDMLSPTDPMAMDCKALFERTFAEDCNNRQVNVEVQSAQRGIVDGLDVDMHVRVCEGAMCHYHRATCVWEVSTDHTDAKLLQVNQAPPTGQDELEKAGLIATLKLHVPLCDSPDVASVADASDSQLLQKFSLGELSRYVGYEHVYDNTPVYSALEMESVPAEVDFRVKYPQCYPNHGQEVVRNQGTCGSCWAFAGATTTMQNLCHSDTKQQHSFFNANDRLEVSVQKIMSCKAAGASDAMGCLGGHLTQFDDEASTWGLTRERDNGFMCGGADPKKHFAQQPAYCDKFPWGGTCSGNANPKWWWGKSAIVSGESAMKTFLASGMGLYVSMDAYGNFVSYKSGVYKSLSGGKKGGHAMNCLGYGVDGTTKYWLIQNSWGLSWGENGLVRFLRGSNLAGIEDHAGVVRAWVDGGTEPPCQDSASGSGLMGGSGAVMCSAAAAYCNHGAFGSTVSSNCAKTCGTCSRFNGAGKSPSPPSPPPSPRPPPSPSPSQLARKGCCKDKCSQSSDCWKGGWGHNDKLFCDAAFKRCTDRSTYSTYGTNCQLCKTANGSPPSPPPPPPSPTQAPAPAAPPAPAGSQVCSFESSAKPYCGIWSDDKSDEFDWTRQRGKTPSSGTGPDRAADGSYYLFTESSKPCKMGDTATLKSTPIAIAGDDAYVGFQYHMYSRNGVRDLGTLKVSVGGNDLWDDSQQSTNRGANVWHSAHVPLKRYNGKSIQVEISGVRGNSYRGDTAIDKIVLFAGHGGPPSPSPSQPSTPPPDEQKGCCNDGCSQNSDCWKGGWDTEDQMFCCPVNKICMAKDSHGTSGPICDACGVARLVSSITN